MIYLIKAIPVVVAAQNIVSITCATNGADIYYRIGQSGSFTKYTAPFEISQDITIQAYSRLTVQRSQTVTETLQYDDGIDEPDITCDGEYVEINCNTIHADIWYRIGTSGEFSQYEAPIEISSNVTVQAYSTVDNKTSEIVAQTCTYVPIAIADPVISCVDNIVSIACMPTRAEIFYRTNGSGSYQTYTIPFEINADTLVEAYATYKQQTSNTVSETCEYFEEHNYANDYLTLRAKSAGTICWKAFSNLTKTIQ